MELGCQSGQVIRIFEAWYGRVGGERKESCEKDDNPTAERCGVDVSNSIKFLCEGSRGCQVTAKDEYFSKTDCSSDVKKHLQVKHDCIPYSKYSKDRVLKTESFASPKNLFEENFRKKTFANFQKFSRIAKKNQIW